MLETKIIAQLLVLFSSLFLAGRCYFLFENKNNTSLMVMSLGGAFIALAAAANLSFSGANQNSLTLLRMLDNLALYAAIPLLASALLDLCHNFNWSKAAWGRWLLVLFALFELCRRSEVGLEYSQLMSLLCVGTILYSAGRWQIRKQASSLALLSVLCGLLLGASLLIFSPFSLIPELSKHFSYSLSLSLGLVVLTLGLKKLPDTDK